MTSALLFVIFVIAIAFIFDFINGFHDAANSIATMVATGIIKPRWAVLWAAFFNFIAFLFFHMSVASTVGTGLVHPSIIDTYLIFAALVGAIIWNLITWYFGLPSSSSHALIGGLVGAALFKGGISSLEFLGLSKVIIAIVLSPLIGLILGLTLMRLVSMVTHHFTQSGVQFWFGKLQFVSAAMLSLAHGGNDAQKTMGIIAVLLFSSHLLTGDFYVPFWVKISCNLVMALGTLAGGWRIVHTLGEKITKLNTVSGACAETSAAITLFTATHFGIPVSTTHTITGSIAGVGMTNRLLTTNWSTLRRIVWAWIFTLPIAALFAAGLMFIEPWIKALWGIV